MHGAPLLRTMRCLRWAVLACGELLGPSVWPERSLTFLFVSLCSWIPILGILSLTTPTSLCWFDHALSRLTGFFGASLSHCVALLFLSPPCRLHVHYDVLALAGTTNGCLLLCPLRCPRPRRPANGCLFLLPPACMRACPPSPATPPPIGYILKRHLRRRCIALIASRAETGIVFGLSFCRLLSMAVNCTAWY